MDALIGYAQIIIPILAVIFVWRYVVLLAKRISLILCLRRYRGQIEWKRRIASVFVHDGGTDFTVHGADGDTDVAIFSTPHRRGRYAFSPDGTVEIIKTRRRMFGVNPGRVPNGTASLTTARTVKKYHIPASDGGARRVLLLHPTPAEISAGSEYVGCGDSVCGYTLASASSLAGSLDCASRGSAI